MMNFCDNISNFYHWMAQSQDISAKSRVNYISWLKFLSVNYVLDNDITDEKISQIINYERNSLNHRKFYRTEKDLVNFKSALRKYIQFVESDYLKVLHETIISETEKIRTDNTISVTEKDAIIRSRIGQGIFRDRLVAYWRGCSVSNCKMINILVASHIKPWRSSSNSERLDLFNGLLLTPNYDKLFDCGFISFDDNGTIIFSKEFPKSERTILHIHNDEHLRIIDFRHFEFLKYHRERCLIQ